MSWASAERGAASNRAQKRAIDGSTSGSPEGAKCRLHEITGWLMANESDGALIRNGSATRRSARGETRSAPAERRRRRIVAGRAPGMAATDARAPPSSRPPRARGRGSLRPYRPSRSADSGTAARAGRKSQLIEADQRPCAACRGADRRAFTPSRSPRPAPSRRRSGRAHRPRRRTSASSKRAGP